MSLSFQNAIQSGQALKKKLAGLFLFSASNLSKTARQSTSPRSRPHLRSHLRLCQRTAWQLSLFFAVVFFCALCLFGCGETVSDASFAEQLDLIDACILNGQKEDALTLIDKASDDAIGLVRQLSIAKRYIKLDEIDKTKKFVEDALKKQPEAPELNALYANILLSEGNVLGAMKYTDKLKNTKWSPLYTEVVIRRIVAENIFMDGDYTDYFVKAAEATHNERWLVDAAVVESRRGNYKKAAGGPGGRPGLPAPGTAGTQGPGAQLAMVPPGGRPHHDGRRRPALRGSEEPDGPRERGAGGERDLPEAEAADRRRARLPQRGALRRPGCLLRHRHRGVRRRKDGHHLLQAGLHTCICLIGIWTDITTASLWRAAGARCSGP